MGWGEPTPSPTFQSKSYDDTVVIWAILWSGLILLGIWQIGQTLHKGISHLKRLPKVPCSRCVYFTGDYRLKCPVHPLLTLSEESINCRDFEPICPESKKIPLKFHLPRYFKSSFSKIQ